MTLDYKQIGHRIRTLRKRQAISQAELAERTGYSVPYISHIETGIKQPSLTAVVNIAATLECTADQLLYDNQTQKSTACCTEAEKILSDCSLAEQLFLLEVLKAIKHCVWINEQLFH